MYVRNGAWTVRTSAGTKGVPVAIGYAARGHARSCHRAFACMPGCASTCRAAHPAAVS